MKKRLRYPVLLILFGFLCIRGSREFLAKEAPEKMRAPSSEKIINKERALPAAEVDKAQSPPQVKEAIAVKSLKLKKEKRRPASAFRIPMTSTSSFRGTGHLAVVSDIRALKPSEYSPEMGEVISQSREMIYFRPSSGRQDHNFANVVYDKANNRFYPLSSVLRVQNVASENRDQLLQSGFQEFYYSTPNRLLYVSSAHDRLFQDYSALTSQGYKVSVEVIRGSHRSR